MPIAWLEEIRRTVGRWRGAGLGPAWVVAVSGGSDSVGLLRVLHELAPGLGLRLSVAHLDHGARGEAGRLDAEFVAGLAEGLGLPFDLGHWRPSRATHFEADARRGRYEWLAGVARARGADAVAVGHTRDDQAETVLHRILRGTGLRGLSGIPSRRPLGEELTLVRPLLGVAREEIRGYLGSLGQTYREDATNADLSRTRARIRHDLLPRLEAEYNPRVAEALARLGDQAGAAHRATLRRLGPLVRAAAVSIGPDAVVLRRGELARSPAAVRAELIRLAWRRAGWPEGGMDARRWLRLAALVDRDRGRGRFSVGAGIEARLTTDLLRLAPSAPDRSVPAEPVLLPIPGSVAWGGGRLATTLDPEAPRDESVDLARLEPFGGDGEGPPAPALLVRPPAPGDRFEPLGMGGRTTPLNDFFRGRPVPRDRRAAIPLVCDRRGIVWVAGHRIAHRVRRTEATRRTLGLSWRPGDPEA